MATATEAPKRQIIIRRAVACVRCGSINSFRKTCGTRHVTGGIGIAWAHCADCGQLAQIREYPYNGRDAIDADYDMM